MPVTDGYWNEGDPRLPTRRGDHLPLVLCFYVAIPLQYWLIGIDWYGMFAICIPVYGFLLLPAITALGGDTENFLERTTRSSGD